MDSHTSDADDQQQRRRTRHNKGSHGDENGIGITRDKHGSCAMSAAATPDECTEVRVLGFDEYDVQSDSQREIMEAGGALLSFACVQSLSAEQVTMVSGLVNLSSFPDETRDNFVPRYEDEDNFPFILVKTVYLLPSPAFIDWISPEKLASTPYQSNCQIASTYFWEQTQVDTFRFTKPIIPRIYNMTVQFRVSELPRETLDALSHCIDGIPIDRGLLMERTKRSKVPKIDRCLKAKSVLLYTKVDGGILCHNLTVIMLSSIPTLVAHIVTRYGSVGTNETMETVSNTRRYLRQIDMQDGKK